MICSINVRDKVLPVLVKIKELIEAEGLSLDPGTWKKHEFFREMDLLVSVAG